MSEELVRRLRYAAKPHQSSPLERDTLLAQAADRIEALEGALRDIIGMPQIAGDVAADSMRIIAERGLKRRTK